MKTPKEVKEEFLQWCDRRRLYETPPQPKYTIVVPPAVYDGYIKALLPSQRYTDMGTPSENVLWQGHIIVRGDR